MSASLPPGVGHFDNARPLAGSAPVPGMTIVIHDASEPETLDLPPLADFGDMETLERCAGLEQNDTDNGHRLLAHFGLEVLHVREVGWHTWTGQVWRREGGDEAVTAYAQRTARRIHGEAQFFKLTEAELAVIEAAKPIREKDPKEWSRDDRQTVTAADEAVAAVKSRRARVHQFATASGNGGKIANMVAQAIPHRSCGPRDLDADNMLFNCENVTLRFRKVEAEESKGNQHPVYGLQVDALKHDRRHRITKMAPVIYDPKAKCPKFLEFMERFQPNEEVRKFIQIYHGLALTGQTGQQCFIYSYGTGANGKSTFMEAMGALFGPYSDLLNAESLTGAGQRRGDQATPDFAELPGVRYLRISELPRGEPLKEALVKALTGGEEIKARHLNKGFFKYQPVFKAVMSGNDLPSIGGVDNGIWRRVKLVVWSVMIPEDERRPMEDVLGEFEAERSGILNWLLEGLHLFMKEGLRTPAEVAAATASYREEMDPIGAFAAACIEEAEGHFETARKVYEAFVAWCEANSVRPWKETTFGRAMPQKGFVRENTRVRRYLNIRLHDVPIPEPTAPRAPKSAGESHD